VAANEPERGDLPVYSLRKRGAKTRMLEYERDPLPLYWETWTEPSVYTAVTHATWPYPPAVKVPFETRLLSPAFHWATEPTAGRVVTVTPRRRATSSQLLADPQP